MIEELNSSLKAGEFHHGVWNLSQPQWGKTLVEPERMRYVHQFQVFDRGKQHLWLKYDDKKVTIRIRYIKNKTLPSDTFIF